MIMLGSGVLVIFSGFIYGRFALPIALFINRRRLAKLRRKGVELIVVENPNRGIHVGVRDAFEAGGMLLGFALLLAGIVAPILAAINPESIPSDDSHGTSWPTYRLALAFVVLLLAPAFAFAMWLPRVSGIRAFDPKTGIADRLETAPWFKVSPLRGLLILIASSQVFDYGASEVTQAMRVFFILYGMLLLAGPGALIVLLYIGVTLENDVKRFRTRVGARAVPGLYWLWPSRIPRS